MAKFVLQEGEVVIERALGEAETYGVTHIHAGVKDAATWADRLQRWSKGEALEAAAARVVKR